MFKWHSRGQIISPNEFRYAFAVALSPWHFCHSEHCLHLLFDLENKDKCNDDIAMQSQCIPYTSIDVHIFELHTFSV